MADSIVNLSTGSKGPATASGGGSSFDLGSISIGSGASSPAYQAQQAIDFDNGIANEYNTYKKVYGSPVAAAKQLQLNRKDANLTRRIVSRVEGVNASSILQSAGVNPFYDSLPILTVKPPVPAPAAAIHPATGHAVSGPPPATVTVTAPQPTLSQSLLASSAANTRIGMFGTGPSVLSAAAGAVGDVAAPESAFNLKLVAPILEPVKETLLIPVNMGIGLVAGTVSTVTQSTAPASMTPAQAPATGPSPQWSSVPAPAPVPLPPPVPVAAPSLAKVIDYTDQKAIQDLKDSAKPKDDPNPILDKIKEAANKVVIGAAVAESKSLVSDVIHLSQEKLGLTPPSLPITPTLSSTPIPGTDPNYWLILGAGLLLYVVLKRRK